jgi:DNA modification methylase
LTHRFYSDRIQVAKATANTRLNPSGRETKTATAFISDICLTTTSKERVKLEDGHLIRWQKPLALLDRVLLPFTDEGDWILDPFSGSNSTGLWCKNNNRNYTGIELDKEVFKIGKERIIDYYNG